MATWFAQTSNANINAANMWNSAPGGGGTVLTWPPAPTDILVANNKLVRLNVSTTVAEIRNDATGGATPQGYFAFTTNDVTLTADAYLGSTQTLMTSNTPTGPYAFVGNMYSGAFVSTAIAGFNAPGTLTITGNIYAGNAGAARGIVFGGTGTINIIGDIFGGSASDAEGIYTTTACNITHTGNVVAGSNAIARGIRNGGSGTVAVSGYAQASTVAPAIINDLQGIVTVGETRSASNGQPAVTGAFRYASAIAAKSMPYTPDGQISMTVLDVPAIVPAESDVRKTVVYGDGDYVGTLPLGRSRTSMAGRF